MGIIETPIRKYAQPVDGGLAVYLAACRSVWDRRAGFGLKARLLGSSCLTVVPND